MKRLWFGLLLFIWAPWALAIAPYMSADKLPDGSLAQVLDALQQKTE